MELMSKFISKSPIFANYDRHVNNAAEAMHEPTDMIEFKLLPSSMRSLAALVGSYHPHAHPPWASLFPCVGPWTA